MGGCQIVKDYFDSVENGSDGQTARPSAQEDAGDAASDGAVYYDGIPRLRPGVAISVQVGAAGQTPSVMQVQVDQNGEATLQYLLQDPVYCNGLTLDAFKQKLIKCYQVYIKQPVVTVSFLPVDGNNGVSPYGTVTVLGEVQMPGPVNMPATMDLTVTKVLKLAGGLKPFADKNKIRVTSCDKDGNKRRTYINLNEIGREGLISKDIALRAGDVVWVPESWY
ncbi:MAG: polysaccharide biosynthesis/export family protein [Kiritimatiellia bacterium]